MNGLNRLLWCILGVLLLLLCVAPRPADAQVVTAPKALEFVLSDSDLALTLSEHVDFFQCTSVTAAGTCVGQAATPFQAGFDVPRASITTLSPPDTGGQNRSISLLTAPASGVLPALPAGVFFVAGMISEPDPLAGATAPSARSSTSNPFLGAGKTPAAASNLLAK